MQVRLTEDEIKAIKESAIKNFGKNVKVWIFGSRVDLTKKGGDIDIYIETEDLSNRVDKKIKFLVDLQNKIGEQKIDVIIAKTGCNKFYCKEAKQTGIQIL